MLNSSISTFVEPSAEKISTENNNEHPYPWEAYQLKKTTAVHRIRLWADQLITEALKENLRNIEYDGQRWFFSADTLPTDTGARSPKSMTH
jgi:hypothetical protein